MKKISPSPISLSNWYLENAKISGTFSTKIIEDPINMRKVSTVIKQSFQANKNWTTAAQQLVDRGIVIQDETIIRQDFQTLLDAARKAMAYADDLEQYPIYRRQMLHIQDSIKDIEDIGSSSLKRAYQNVLDLTENASEKQFVNAIDNAIYFKAKYNAERIAQSEWTKAYRQGFISEVNYDEDAIGWRWVLADDHDNTSGCDCEMYARADLYGMGKGVFPKDVMPPFTHPHCWCNTVVVYKGEADENDSSDFDINKAKSYVDKKDLGDVEPDGVEGNLIPRNKLHPDE